MYNQSICFVIVLVTVETMDMFEALVSISHFYVNVDCVSEMPLPRYFKFKVQSLSRDAHFSFITLKEKKKHINNE